MRKTYFYTLYTPDGEKCLGVYESLADIVTDYYGISRDNPNFKKKLHSLHNIIYWKKKALNPRFWVIYKLKDEDEENGK